MKAYKRFLLIFFLISICSYQYLSAQISIGLRETRFPWIQYTYKDCLSARLEQSVYAEKLKFQYVRLYIGYSHRFDWLTLKAEPYFGSTYSDLYYSTGGSLGADIRLHKRLTLEGEFVPHYDSQLGYQTCYLGSLSCDITKEIAVTGTFTNRPEYRMPEKRVKLGLLFHVGSLRVLPEISLPIKDGEGRNLKMLASMAYSF